MNPSPSLFGLPHSSWRPHQWETIQWIVSQLSRNTELPVVCLESPTGTGKSAIATAASHGRNSTVLVATLGLLDQYTREYGYFGLKGRQEYPCADPSKVEHWQRHLGETPTAFDCHVSPMHRCRYAVDCEYLAAKAEAERAERLVVTYKYAILSRMVQQRKGLLVLDEGHNAAEEVLDFGTFRVTERRRRQWGLPKFRLHCRRMLVSQDRDRLEGWLVESCEILARRMKGLEKESPDYARTARFHAAIDHARESLAVTDFFLDSGETAGGMILRPLDAKPIAKGLWKCKGGILLMSATIGNPGPIIDELGLESAAFRSTPHLIPKEKRPVYDLGFERMTHTNIQRYGEALFTAQAHRIAKWIKTLPVDWRGLVLTSSLDKVERMRANLAKHLGERVWQSDETTLRRRVRAFITDPRKGTICVETIQGWGQGLDLRGELARFVVVAGVPFNVPSDPYYLARIRRPGGRNYMDWVAYSAVSQAAGRITRADLDEKGEHYLKVCALCDGSATTRRALRFYPVWFRDAIERPRVSYAD